MLRFASRLPLLVRLLSAPVLLMLALSGCAGLAPTDDQRTATDHQGKYAQLVRMGDNIRQNGDPAAARAFYERAYALDSSKPEPLIGIAEAALRTGAMGDAAETYRRALAIAPQRTDLHYGYGRALLGLGQTDRAMDAFTAHLQVNPDDQRAYNALGVAFDLQGEHAAARSVYLDGLEVSPENAALRNNLALSLALAGAHDDALATLQDLEQHTGRGARTQQSLALILALAGRVDEAADIARRGLSPIQARSMIAFYRSLQGASGSARAIAVFTGESPPALAATGAPPFGTPSSSSPATTHHATPGLTAADRQLSAR